MVAEKLALSQPLTPRIDTDPATGNRYMRLRDDDGSFAAVGGSVTRRWGNFSGGISYEHGYNYDRFFSQNFSTPNDFDVFLRYGYRPSEHLRITPRVSYATRFDDNWSLERHTLNLKVDVEQRITGRWWLVMTPRLRYYTFYGDDWYRFLARCRYTIGMEGGSSILDRDGSVRACVEARLAEQPDATFAAPGVIVVVNCQSAPESFRSSPSGMRESEPVTVFESTASSGVPSVRSNVSPSMTAANSCR